MKNLNDFKETIDFFKKHKINEYQLKYKGEIISSHYHFIDDDEIINKTKYTNSNNNKSIISDYTVNKLHPKNINNAEFWKYAKIQFPKFSVCGVKVKSIKQCNEETLNLPKEIGFFNLIKRKINDSKDKLNILEIGFGHGNIFNELNKITNYIGIDFYKIKPLNKFKNLHIIEKSGIPEFIKNDSLDIIYSVNVLQHCSQQDRFDYITQSYNKLKTNGIFLGTCFIVSKENKDEYYWGFEDSNGRKYCSFLNQLTEIDTNEELLTHIDNIGFKVEKCLYYQNMIAFILKK